MQAVGKSSEHGYDGSWTEHSSYNYSNVQDYPTVLVAGYCFPAELKLRYILGVRFDHITEALMLYASQAKRAWPALLVVATFAAVLGFIYLLLLRCSPQVLVVATLVLAVLFPLAVGVLCLWGWILDQKQGSMREQDSILFHGNDMFVLLVSFALIGVGLTMATLAYCMRQSLLQSVHSVANACKCMFGMPSLLFEPFLSTVVGLCSSVGLLVGYELLGSCGSAEQHVHISGTYVQGLSRYMVYRDLELIYVWAYVLIAAWLMETGIALRSFAVALATQRWYFNEHFTPPLSLFEGFFIGATKHLGSMALGALCIAPCRVAQWVRQGRASLKGPWFAECLGCWAFWDGMGKLMHSSAYVIVAVDSLPFFLAAQKASDVRSMQLESVVNTNGLIWVFQAWGVLAISGLSGTLAWFLVVSLDAFTDQASPHYVDNATAVAVTGAVLGLGIGATFMHMLRNVADTLVFCEKLQALQAATFSQADNNHV